MEQSLRDSLNQLVDLQSRQLNLLNNMASQNNMTNQRMSQMNDAINSPKFMSSYMNYSPDFMPPMFPFSASTQAAQQRFQGMANQITQGPNFIDTFAVNRSRVSNEQRLQMANEYGAKVSNAALAGGGVLASGIADIGIAAAMPGLISGAAFGLAGGAVVGGLFDIGLKQNQQNLAYNQYLLRESYRFINARESTNERDIAGFSTKQRFETANYLRHFNTEQKISDQDTMTLLQKFTEGGLLKDVKDLETFKDKMTQLTKYVKKSALLLNETFEDITQLMSDMKKAGIDVQNFDYLSAKSKVLGSFTGMSAGDAMRFTAGTAQNLVQGTAFSATTQTERVGDTLLYMDALLEKSKINKQTDVRQKELFNIITNMGGPQGATTVMSQYQNQMLSNPLMSSAAINFFDYNAQNNSFAFNPEAFSNYINSGQTMDQATKAATEKIMGLGTAGKNAWMQNKQTYLMNSLNDDQVKQLISRNLNAIKLGVANEDIRNSNLSNADMISLLMKDNSVEGKLFGQMLDYYQQDNGQLSRLARNRTAQQNIISGINANRPGFGYEVTNLWEKFKDRVGDAFAPIGETTTKAMQKVSDWWYGTEYTVDRGGKNREYSDDAIRRQGMDISMTIIKGVQEGLNEAKARGFNVKDDVLKMFSADDSSMQEWKSKVINYKREVFTTTASLGEDIKKFYDTIKDASKSSGISETTVAGLLRYGNQTGNFMGMNQNIMSQVSSDIGRNVYNASQQDKIKYGSQYLGNLTSAYGGNEQLALLAYMTSKTEVDKALRQAGIGDPDEMRRNGNINQIKNVRYDQVQNYFNSETTKALSDINMATTQGRNIDYNEALKPGLGNKDDVNQIIREESLTAGLNANMAATLVSAESGGIINDRTINQGYYDSNGKWHSATTDWGLTQINDQGSVIADFMGKSITLADGRTVTVNAQNYKTDPRINAAMGFRAMAGYLEESGGNPYIAYGMYNAGPGTLGVFKTYLKRQGITNEADVKKALAAMPMEDVVKIMRNTGTKGFIQSANNIETNFAPKYTAGVITESPETTTEEVYKDSTGKALTADEVKRYKENDMMQFINAEGMDTTGFKKLFLLDQKTRQDYLEAYNTDQTVRHFQKGPPTRENYLKAITDKREDYVSALGGLWGIDYTGDTTSYATVMKKSREEADDIDALLQEYLATDGSLRGNTKWAGMSTQEKMMKLQTRKIIADVRGEKDMFPDGFNKYLTQADMKEIQKIQPEGGVWNNISAFFTGDKKYVYNAAGANANATPDQYLDWLATSGKMEYKTVGGSKKYSGTAQNILNEVTVDINAIEAKEKNLITHSEKLLAGIEDTKFTNKLSGSEQQRAKDLMRKALETKSKEDIDALGAFMGDLSASNKINLQDDKDVNLNAMRDALWTSMQLQDTEKMKSPLRGLKTKIEDWKSYTESFGRYGSVLVEALGGTKSEITEFQKRFLDSEKGGALNWETTEVQQTVREVVAGKQELVSKLSSIMKDKEALAKFVDKVVEIKGLGETEREQLIKRLDEINASNTGKQEKLMEIVNDTLGALDVGLDEKKQDIQDATGTAQDLDKAYQGLVKQMNTTVDSMSGAIVDLQVKQSALETKFNKGKLSSLFPTIIPD